MIRVDDCQIELKIVHSYQVKPFSGLKKITREIPVKRWFNKTDIVSIQEYITSRNKISKIRCLILDARTNQFYAVYHSVEDVRLAIKSIVVKNKIGFR